MTLLAMGFWLQPAMVLAQTQIGYVNIARVFEEAPQAEAARKQLEKEFAPRDQNIVKMQKDLRELEEKLARDSAIMSVREQRRLERDLLSNKREIKRETEEFREDFSIRRNEVFEKLRRRIIQVINTIGKEKKFDLIINEGAVVFAGKKVDITEVVLEKLRKEGAGR